MLDLAALSPAHFFLGTFLGFSALYGFYSIVGYYLFNIKKIVKPYQNKHLRPGQIKIEVQRSFVSILMFSILSLWVWYGYKSKIYSVDFAFNLKTFVFESIILFFWNEIHFYTIHRAFHLKSFFKYHSYHHFSIVPTPFSIYSFHWSEGLLLGTVMPIAMLFHDFNIASLIFLPIMSITLNILGHSNADFAQGKPLNHWMNFSKRHSMHHQNPVGNFGFFLPWLDMAFGTKKNEQ